MVQKASTTQSQSWNALLSPNQLLSRRISSIFLMGLLLTVFLPFSPLCWLIPTDGPELLDQFLGPPLVLGALWAQWQIANIKSALGVEVGGVRAVYRPNMYWQGAFLEFGTCVAVGVARHEYLRRVIAVGLMGGLWVLGWEATPRRIKREAWEQLKWVWTLMAVSEVSGRAMGGRRRRW